MHHKSFFLEKDSLVHVNTGLGIIRGLPEGRRAWDHGNSSSVAWSISFGERDEVGDTGGHQ